MTNPDSTFKNVQAAIIAAVNVLTASVAAVEIRPAGGQEIPVGRLVRISGRCKQSQ